jgi:hypothetical protein
MVQDMKCGQKDMASLICVHFMHSMQGMHKKEATSLAHICGLKDMYLLHKRMKEN